MDPADERLGILGGTFDPIHVAHLLVARHAQAALSLHRVLFIPAGDPWRKAGRAVSDARHRLGMVHATVDEIAGFDVSDLEIERAGPTYTVDTLRALRDEGYRQLWFIVGSDALADMPHWHRPEELIALARLAVIVRPGAELDAAHLDDLIEGLAAAVDWVAMPPSPISATDLRTRLAADGDTGLAEEIPAPALAYIREHGLYRAATDA